jgi:hypothetical protein
VDPNLDTDLQEADRDTIRAPLSSPVDRVFPEGSVRVNESALWNVRSLNGIKLGVWIRIWIPSCRRRIGIQSEHHYPIWWIGFSRRVVYA